MAEGQLRGIRFDGVNRYLGIPYAAAPVGDLRWRPAEAAKPWRGTRDASRFGNACAQVTTLGVFAGPSSVEEDCLYLNVFTTGKPARAGEKMPVIVWIHGGGNHDSASTDYDGSKLASGGPEGVPTVVVTVNYRLGVLGTFSHPAINAEGHTWGNYGLLDQQAALRWVQKNIAAFGGDPGRVALGGQSAGSYDVGANMISPSAKNLFQRVILQSSPGFIAWLPTAQTAATAGSRFAAEAGCSGSGPQAASCLRALSVPRILQLQGTLKTPGSLSPYLFVDGTVIPTQPEQAWDSGNFNKTPVMGGATRDEATFHAGINQYFAGPPQAGITAAEYPGLMAPGAFCVWCNEARKMPPGAAEQYPLAEHGGDPLVAYVRVSTDGARCRELHVLQKLAPQVPTYAYDFSYQDAPYYFPKMPGYKARAAHTIDIQFLFRNYHGGHLGVNLDQTTGLPRELNAAETRLSDQLVAAWTRFAATGNPNGTGDSPWPRFTADGNGRYLVQDIPLATKTQAQFRSDYKCDFFDPQLKY